MLYSRSHVHIGICVCVCRDIAVIVTPTHKLYDWLVCVWLSVRSAQPVVSLLSGSRHSEILCTQQTLLKTKRLMCICTHGNTAHKRKTCHNSYFKAPHESFSFFPPLSRVSAVNPLASLTAIVRSVACPVSQSPAMLCCSCVVANVAAHAHIFHFVCAQTIWYSPLCLHAWTPFSAICTLFVRLNY